MTQSQQYSSFTQLSGNAVEYNKLYTYIYSYIWHDIINLLSGFVEAT